MAVIFITGAARSGTSLTTRIMQAHGCFLGDRPDRINPLYENVDVRERVIKPYLKSIGADPLGQNPLPDTDNLTAPPDFRSRVDGFVGTREPRAYKCAKATLIWPVFHSAYPEAKWIIVRRDKQKIADSCVRTNFMRAYETHREWERWVEEHEKRFEKMRAELDAIETWPDSYIEDPASFALVAAHCGLRFSEEAVRKSIDRIKWHAG